MLQKKQDREYFRLLLNIVHELFFIYTTSFSQSKTPSQSLLKYDEQ